ncbi:MAG: sensor histidine kinase [Patescibacteria group bacterium]
MFKNLKTRTKLFVVFSFTVVLTIAAVGRLVYQTAKDNLYKQTVNYLNFLSETAKTGVVSFLEGAKQRAVDFSSDGFIRTSLKQIMQGDQKAILDLSAHLRDNKQSLDPSIYNINVVDLNGKVVASVAADEIGTSLLEYEEKDYILQAQKLSYGRAVLSDVIKLGRLKDKISIAAFAPLTDKDTGEILGVIINYIQAASLSDFISSFRDSSIAGVYLVDSKNLMITEPLDFQKHLALRQIVDNKLTRDCKIRTSGSVAYQNYKGVEVFGVSACLNNGWTLIAEASVAESLKGALDIRRIAGYAALLIFLEIMFLIYFIFRDILKQKEVEQMKTDFISFASHQLRTPLTIIKWNTEMLINGDAGELTPDQKQRMFKIELGEKRMACLINSLLNISRLESNRLKIEPKPTDVLLLISSTISELVPYANAKNCHIKFNKPSRQLPLINLDPVLLKQVILNLLGNSINYSKPKKSLVEVTLKQVGRYFQIDVADDGIGIPAAAQNKIFQKFFRADNATKADANGIGLGLYITKLIVETSGGKIWFESAEEKGAKFHIVMPISGMSKKSGGKEFSK